MPPVLIIGSLYLLTAVLTEFVSNNAVAVVVTPIGIGLAQGLGFDPRPFVIAVMVAAWPRCNPYRLSNKHACIRARRL